MSEFEERMKKLAEDLSPAAKTLVKQVLVLEHKRRFANRSELPETFANSALKLAKEMKGENE